MILLFLGCSLTGFKETACTANAECREAFGFGWACDAELGLCDLAEVHPRCASTWPEDLFLRTENYSDAIVIASMFDHTSDLPEVNAARLPVSQVVDQGGLNDLDYAIVECSYEENPVIDDLDYPDAAREIALYLADTLSIPAIVGPATSSQTEEVYNATANLGVFIISPSATSPALTNIDGLVKTDAEPGMLWRTAPPDSLQGAAVAEDMTARGLRDVAVIYQTGPYGEGLAEVFLERFIDEFHTVDSYLFDNDASRDSAVSTAGESGVEEVFFISSEVSDIISFINGAYVNSNYDDKTLFLADGAADNQMLQQTSQSSAIWERIRGSRPAVPDGNVYKAFDTAYAAAYGVSADVSAYTSYSFDATWLAIYGTAWASRNGYPITGKGIAQGLRKVSDGSTVEIRATSWNDVKATFAQSQPIDVMGSSGALDYDPDTEETTTPIEIWTINETGDGFELCTTWCWDGQTPVLCDGEFDRCLDPPDDD